MGLLNMNKIMPVLLLFSALLSSSVGFCGSRHHRDNVRRVVRESGENLLTNSLPQTMDFSSSSWAASSEMVVINGEVPGPLPSSWAQVWSNTATGGLTGFSSVGLGQYKSGSAIFSIYAKPVVNSLVIIKLVVSGNIFISQWTWTGATLVNTFSSPNDLSMFSVGSESVANGWSRLWLKLDVDGITAGGIPIVGTDQSIELILSPFGAAIGGSQVALWGANMTRGDALSRHMSRGAQVFEHLVTKRGKPNDFWFNYVLDAPASNPTFSPSPSHKALYFLSDSQMDVQRAWGITTSSSIGIVLRDHEVAIHHPDLKANIWHNLDEIEGNGIDDDGNGLIDDYNGWDVFSWDNTPDINSSDNILQALDGQHGTQMASFMCAVGNNEPWGLNFNLSDKRAGSVGILWDVPLLGVAWQSAGKPGFYKQFGINHSSSTFACYYAESLNADFRVVNESHLGQTLKDAAVAKNTGMLISCGAGNDGTYSTHSFAANSDNIMVIGAIMDNTHQPSLSNISTVYGPNIWVCGYMSLEGHYYDWMNLEWIVPVPDSSIYSAFTLGYFAGSTAAKSLLWDGNVDVSSGPDLVAYGIIPSPAYTSGATAQASALASMIWGLYPKMDPGEIKQMIARGAINDISGGSTCGGPCVGNLGYGRMSAYRSITLWGLVADTTLTGDVYVSGDVEFAGTVYLNDVTFHIAPSDIYETEILNLDGTVNCVNSYKIDYSDLVGSPVSDPNSISFYVRGTLYNPPTIILYGGSIIFKSNAENPGPLDWGSTTSPASFIPYASGSSLTYWNN